MATIQYVEESVPYIPVTPLQRRKTIWIAVSIFVAFIVLLIIIGIVSAAKSAKAMAAPVQSVFTTVNGVAARGGGGANIGSQFVNNITDPTAPPGSGAVPGLDVTRPPTGTSVIYISDATAANGTIVTVGANSNTLVAVNSPVAAVNINVGPSAYNREGGKITISNTYTFFRSLATFTPLQGVSLIGSGIVPTGYYVTFVAISTNNFRAQLPIKNSNDIFA